LAAPITLRGEVIGALDIFDPNQPHEWNEEDLALVDAVTSQVALAVENARLFEQTQSALAETEALYRASRRIVSSEDMATLYQALVDEMANRLGADQCQLIILDAGRGRNEIVAEFRPSLPEARAAFSRATAWCPAHTLLRTDQRPLAIEDITSSPILAAHGELLARQDVKSALLVPILVRGELIGILQILSISERRAFHEAELDFCQTLASQAAITIENMRALEEQRQTAARLREVDKLKTQFLANMSHELRTPLNSIIGFSRVILKGIDGPLTELQQTDLTAIYSSGQHLLGLINDILDVSKIEAGKMELNFDEVDLKPIIKGVMSTAIGLVKDKRIELEQRVPEDLPNIWADSTRIRQVLLNLVSNATKFTEVGKISLTADYDEEWMTIIVTDTGAGIPEEKLESIFEEFTQVDGSTTRSVGGTGLGLPISRHFVEMHGGEITVTSEVGLGSTFKVKLPLRPGAKGEDQTGEEQAAGEATNKERRIILAVDDDPGVISLYRRYLESEGFYVIGVTNSDEVFEKAAELQPFAITLDVLMPNKDGWQVLRELKDAPETQHIPIVICSIVSDEGRGFSMGAADYLVKPIMEEELLAALQRLDQQDDEALILVVDDQADDILLIRRILEAQHRYRVIEANGGQMGIDLVREHKPDILILDLMMPEVDGFAVLEAVKRESSTRNIPVIVITAKELTEVEEQRLTGQVEVLLHKGLFTEGELLEDLKKALSRIDSMRP
jgi:signal transduction histidine kinase/CheY-like chemotaxis protein